MKIDEIQGVVALQNYGSSGTLFLQSLFDGHPNILMTPALYSHNFYYFWENHLGPQSAGDLVDAFMKEHRYWFHPEDAVQSHGLHQLGLEMNEAVSVPEESFKNGLLRYLEAGGRISRKSFFTSTYLAYAAALGRKVDAPATIVFPIHSLPKRHAGYLTEDFPCTKFLHMIREPIANINSLMRHMLHEQLPVNVLECAFAQILNDYMKHWGRKNSRYVYGDRPFFEKYANQSKAVRLEDLHTNPKPTLEALCHWIRIPWNESLLQSTFDGKKWWNRPQSVRTSGFDVKMIDPKRGNFIGKFDEMRLYLLLDRKCTSWNYPVPPYSRNVLWRALTPALILLPFKSEILLLKKRLVFILSALRRFLSRSLQLISKKLYFTRDPEALSRKLFAFVQMAFYLTVPLLIVRDYVAIRWWLYRAWITGFSFPSPEVRLLSVVPSEVSFS